MPNKRAICLLVTMFYCTFLAASFGTQEVSGWSNGGYSGDPANPGYGTHDWIAQHALDWLPQGERQFFTDHLASYLYGTELPDNRQTPGGIGDTTRHHVYFYADGSLQDDTAAVRAREEYASAKQAFDDGNFSGAAMHLGMVAHYVADVAVFGHVMGSATAWGTETHHSNYEDYVLDRTRNYTGGFNSYLVFDGNLNMTPPYDMTVAVARDSTFNKNGNCTWMDQHYDWSNPAFRSRAGETLNLAVNAVADVLHGFYSETAIPEFPSSFILLTLVCAALPLLVCLKKKFTLRIA
ncbi:MAG: zinc dependent phospholipase C family protein [Candidatus Bathyarchaeia archaeon]